MKNILLFKRDSLNHDSINYWSELIAGQLEKRGVLCHYLSLVDTGRIASDLSKLLSNVKMDAAIMVNAYGQQDYIDGNNNNLWDAVGIPFFNYIVDHPIEHGSNLDSSCKNYHVICVDKKHELYIRKYYPDIKSVHFLPLAGFGNMKTPSDDRESFGSREYATVLTAGLMEPDMIKEHMDQLPETIRNVTFDWTDYMKEHLDVSPEESLEAVLVARYSEAILEERDFCRQIAKVAYLAVPYIRTFIRKLIVEELIRSGLEFHLWGNGWENLMKRYRENMVISHGDIEMSKTPDIYRKTKLAINILPMFKAGSHDRIATAQINGAAVISDGNEYLRDFYRGTDSIYLYSLTDIKKLPDQIKVILSDEDVLFEKAVKGQTIARQKLTWDASGDALYSILKEQI